jgi:hypothetical protein
MRGIRGPPAGPSGGPFRVLRGLNEGFLVSPIANLRELDQGL